MASTTTTTAPASTATASSKPFNFHDVASADHFRSLLSEDLNRVSLINFYAPWAEPCKQMNEVVEDLARQHPKALVLNVEAEAQSDIAESFDVDSVPYFVMIRGHTLLARIVGADVKGLREALANHMRAPPQALSRTDKEPRPASSVSSATMAANMIESDEVDENESETPEQLQERILNSMRKDKVVLFMKGSPDMPRCGFSRKAVGLLRDKKIEFGHFDILSDERVRQGLKVLNNWPTFPQLIIKGEFVGGLDIMTEMVENGELDELLVEA